MIKHIERQNTILMIIFTILLLIGTNVFQLFMNPVWEKDYQDVKQQQGKIYEIIEVNGEIFDSFAKLTNVGIENTGTMMRFTHFLDKHDPSIKQIMTCPECGEYIPSTIPKSAFEVPDVPLDEIPETLDQILKDAQEIQYNINTLIFSAVNQGVTLRVTLERLRDPDAYLGDEVKKIYKTLPELGLENSPHANI